MGKAHITADLRLPSSWANQKTSRLAENSTGKPKETTMSLDEHIFWRHFLKGMLGYLCTWSWWDPWEGSSYLYISKALHTHAHVPRTSMHMYAKHTLVRTHTHTGRKHRKPEWSKNKSREDLSTPWILTVCSKPHTNDGGPNYWFKMSKCKFWPITGWPLRYNDSRTVHKKTGLEIKTELKNM